MKINFKGETIDLSSPLVAKFEEYHAANPDIYLELLALAHQLRAKGWKHYSINGLFEVLRWQHAMKVTDPEGFKLNNSYRAFYARLLMRDNPELKGFFEVRVSCADGDL
jgi:hypothetical protein